MAWFYYTKTRTFMNKNAVLVGRDGFEAHQFLATPLFSRDSAIVRQIKITSLLLLTYVPSDKNFL